MMKLRKLIAFTLMGAATFFSQTIFSEGYYPHWLFVYAGGGASAMKASGLEMRPTSSPGVLSDTSESEQGVAFLGGVGFKFKSIPLGFDFEYIRQPRLDYNADPVITGVSGLDTVRSNLKSQAMFFNVFYDINLGTDLVVPFISAGAGVAKNKVSMSATRILTGQVDNVNTTKSAFAWQGGIGMHLKLTNNIFFDLGYRYIQLGRAQWGPWGASTTKYRIVTNSVSSNLAYVTIDIFFGDQKEVKPPTLINT